ncbi:MAG: DUF3488 domain-containing protein, partial [Candidatus Dormibacteria bacterium]
MTQAPVLPPETVEVGALLGTDQPTFVEVPQEQVLEATADHELAAEAAAEEIAFPLARPTLAASCAMLAVAVMIGGMFLGWKPRLFAGVGGLAGVMFAYYSARTIHIWRWFILSLLGLVGFSALAMLIGEPTQPGQSALVLGLHDLTNAYALVKKAAEQGHVLRPPAPFDPGWRPLIVYLMFSLGYCANWVGCGLRRPPLALLVPLPVLIFASISQNPSDQVLDGVVAFVLMAAGLTVLYRETSEGGAQLSVAFEVRRSLRTLPLLATIVAALLLVIRFGGFLFPAPAYDPAQAAQLPKAVPLSEATDKVLFTVKSGIHGPWRTGVLDVYDGKAWRIPPYAQSKLAHIGNDGVIDRILKPGVKAEFNLEGLDGTVLPSPTRPVGLSEQGFDVNYDSRTGTIRLAAGQVRAGMNY